MTVRHLEVVRVFLSLSGKIHKNMKKMKYHE